MHLPPLNHALRILLTTDFAILLASGMIVPFYAVIVGRIAGDVLDAGFAASVFAVVAGFVSLAAGRFIDKSKRKEHIIALSYLLMSIG